MTTAIRGAQVLHENAYWTGEHDGHKVHGEAWHLAALTSDRDPEVSTQEILYIGQSYGNAGSRNASMRATSHSKLIEAYEENHASDWDVFFTPLIVEETITLNDDHIIDSDDNFQWADPSIQSSLFSADGVRPSKLAVDTLEHLLIAYFEPRMNTKLINWSHTKQNRILRDLGYRLLTAQLLSLHELALFFSAKRQAARTHAIAAEVPGVAFGTEFSIGTFSELETIPARATELIGASMDHLASMAEKEPGVLRIFGDSHPGRNPDFSAWQ